MWGTGFFKGLWITLKNAIRGPVTINYPDERFELPERARWAVRTIRDEDGAEKCTACTNCVRECPDGVLGLEVETDEDKNKTIVSFTYDLGACMFCGLCVEKCPFSALEMGPEYELAVTDPADLMVTLVADAPAAGRKRKKADPAPATEPTSATEPTPATEGGESDG